LGLAPTATVTLPASMTDATGSWSRRFIAAWGVGLGVGALTFWLLRRSTRKKKKKQVRLGGTSLREEIEAACALEAEELDLDLEEIKDEFEAAAAWVGENGGALLQEVLLTLYGCYKQALTGDAPRDRPWGPEASLKWDSWRRLAGISRAKAMSAYVEALREAVPAWSPEDRGEAAESAGKGSSGAFGVTVSTMGQLGDSDDNDVDETPVGQLNELIHKSDITGALKVLRKSADLAFQADKDGMTPMHWAADSDNGEVMKALVELLGNDDALAKSRVNMRDADGNTPLHFAVMSENEEMARLLVEAGADPKVENEEGETPCELASGEEWAAIFSATLLRL